jgi:2-methylcitrate dehydratase PrpD
MMLAERLAAFAAGLEFEHLPADVVASVKLRCLDVLGLTLAASTYEFATPLKAMAADGGPCTIIGTQRTASPASAALVNGSLAHGLDFDDTHAASITHASAVVVPAVLAVAESEGASGRDVVTAAVAGYEAVTRLGMAAPGAFHTRGCGSTRPASCTRWGSPEASRRGSWSSSQMDPRSSGCTPGGPPTAASSRRLWPRAV